MTTSSSSGSSRRNNPRPGTRDLSGSQAVDQSPTSTSALPSTRTATEPRHPDTVVRRTEHHEPDRPPVNVAIAGDRNDQVRWGPVWAGLIVALPTFLLLELAFFALGW